MITTIWRVWHTFCGIFTSELENERDATLCELCGEEAIARVRYEWLCARCGLRRTTIAAGLDPVGVQATAGPADRRRGALRAAIGSGLAAKVLIGAAALAAVGGAVVTDAPPSTTPPPSVPPVELPNGPPTGPVPGDLPDTAADAADTAPRPEIIPAGQGQNQGQSGQSQGALPAEAAAFVEAVQAWSDCLDWQVHLFTATRPNAGEGFDPFGFCGSPPNPAAYGLAAGHGRPDGVGPPDDPGSQADDHRQNP